jgi:ATP-dependent Clp protease adapter protein ClpS
MHLRAPLLLRMSAEEDLELEQALDSEESKRGRKYNVYLLNDNYNMREYVSRVLMMCATVSEAEASSIMTQADWGGSAVVGTWEKEVAQHIYEGMTQAGLRSAMESVESSSRSVF